HVTGVQTCALPISGNSKNAVCTGSERVSSWLRAEKFHQEAEKLKELEENPIIAFEKDFLRWMLSDGAGAFLLTNQPNQSRISLKIHWVQGTSFAHELETCMYAGETKQENGQIKSWSDISPDEWLNNSVFAIKQDIKLLDQYIILKGTESIQEILNKKNLQPEE